MLLEQQVNVKITSRYLSPAQFARWQKAQTAKEPIEIVTLDEAKAAEKQKSTQKKTWIFKADNVRDFAWGIFQKICMGCHARLCGRQKR